MGGREWENSILLKEKVYIYKSPMAKSLHQGGGGPHTSTFPSPINAPFLLKDNGEVGEERLHILNRVKKESSFLLILSIG